MKAKATQAFKWARDGMFVEEIAKGDVIDGRCAEVALAEGWAEDLEDRKVPKKAAKK